MKKIAFTLALAIMTGYVSNAVFASTSSSYTVEHKGDDEKKKSKDSRTAKSAKGCDKNVSTANASGKSCSSANSASATKSCCAAKKSSASQTATSK